MSDTTRTVVKIFKQSLERNQFYEYGRKRKIFWHFWPRVAKMYKVLTFTFYDLIGQIMTFLSRVTVHLRIEQFENPIYITLKLVWSQVDFYYCIIIKTSPILLQKCSLLAGRMLPLVQLLLVSLVTWLTAVPAAGQSVDVLDFRPAAIQLLLTNSSGYQTSTLNLLTKLGTKTQGQGSSSDSTVLLLETCLNDLF